MHKLTIEYTPEVLKERSPWEVNQLTARVIEWLVDYEVYGCQGDDTVIWFDTGKMRDLAILFLCDERQIERLRLD